jgi:hypothetical protein
MVPVSNLHISYLGSVVINVLATGCQGRGFEPGQGDEFFKGYKSAAHLLSDKK